MKFFEEYYGRVKPSFTYNKETKKYEQNDSIPLGFITPYEDNASFRKRKETVDSWASLKNWYGDSYGNSVDNTNYTELRIKNELTKGFRISEEVRRVYFGGGNVVWRVDDPRGFQVEISSDNLAHIIDVCGIGNQGEILEPCLYLRNGANNYLIPESSNEIAEAKTEKLIKKSFLHKNDLVPGSFIEYTRDDSREKFRLLVGRANLKLMDTNDPYYDRLIYVIYDQTKYFESANNDKTSIFGHIELIVDPKIEKFLEPTTMMKRISLEDIKTRISRSLGVSSLEYEEWQKKRKGYIYSWACSSDIAFEKAFINPLKTSNDRVWIRTSLKINYLEIKEFAWV